MPLPSLIGFNRETQRISRIYLSFQCMLQEGVVSYLEYLVNGYCDGTSTDLLMAIALQVNIF